MLLPASALFLDRPMPPARALVQAGAAVALATDFNPGSAFCESLPLVCSLAATQLHLSPAEALAACTVNAAHVLGRADRIGRLAPGYRADITLLDAPDWRYLAYHLGGRIVAKVVVGGEQAEPSMPTRKQRRRSQKGRRARIRDRLGRRGTGKELDEPPEELAERPQPRRATARSRKRSRRRLPQRGGRSVREPPPPSWQRAAKRSLMLGVVIFVFFSLARLEGRTATSDPHS